MEKLLNKTDTKFSPKMFVYSQDDKRFYKCLNEYGGTFTKIFMITIQGWHEKQLIPPVYFALNSESDFAQISTTGSLTDGSMNLGSRNESFLMMPNFP